MKEAVTAYPLCWPSGWKRNPNPTHSRFEFKTDEARQGLMNSLRLLGATEVVLSSNAPLRKSDSQPAAGALDLQLDEPGVAVYFKRNGKAQVIATDKYSSPAENIRALAHTVDAMRTIQRHGSSEILDRTFTGFAALQPAMADRPWWDVLGVSRNATPEAIKAAYTEGARRFHPDAPGGDNDTFVQIARAYKQAQEAS